MDPNRKSWNDRHKQLREALKRVDNIKPALDLFLIQHAMVHTQRLSNSRIYSFEDEVLNDLSAENYRLIPVRSNHSIAWVIWHLARVEDVTMNILVADAQQVLHKSGWNKKLGVALLHTGNGMSDREVREFSQTVNVNFLRKYRLAVGRETRNVVKILKPTDIVSDVNSSRVQRIWKEQAMLPNAKGIIDYWQKRTIGGLLLMPPTRHCFMHLNEARRIRAAIARVSK